MPKTGRSRTFFSMHVRSFFISARHRMSLYFLSATQFRRADASSAQAKQVFLELSVSTFFFVSLISSTSKVFL
jgi:hypothetical protein